MKKTRDDSDAVARRQWPRLNPENIPFLKGITLNQGNEAHVVDISRGGALIETDVRLRPQMKIVFKVITTQGTFRITGAVLRSSIKSLQGTPIYQSAIVFENPLTMLDDLEPPASDAAADADMDAAATGADAQGAEAAQGEDATEETAAAAGAAKTEARLEAVAGTDELDVASELTVAAGTDAGAAARPNRNAMVTPQPRAAAATPVFETPDIFESGDAAPSAPSDEDEDFGPAMNHEDTLVFNVIAPDGLGVSFDANDALNDW